MLEIINNHIERGRIRHALFDFDGTLSLIRAGWQDVMIPMMVELLLETPSHEDEVQLTTVVTDYVTRLTGKQTIYQMIQLADEIRQRGGQPADPLVYKHRYLDLLWAQIGDRVAGLEAGLAAPDDLMVPGARGMLDGLRERGVQCYLASGTDEPFVLNETAALKLTPYFAGIYGAQDDYKRFSKKLVIERLINEHGLAGPEFVVFGDGYVEIEDGKGAGGIAVGLATNEVTRTGLDEWKRARLIEAGADIIAPDFRGCAGLIAYLFDESA